MDVVIGRRRAKPIETGRFMTASFRPDETRRPSLAARLAWLDKRRATGWWRPTSRPDPSDLGGEVRIEDETGSLVAVFHLRCASTPIALAGSRLAGLWDLSRLETGPVVEFGDLRMRADASVPDVLRAAWIAVTAAADRTDAIAILGSCAFPGRDAAMHGQALALLRADHVAPPEWLPQPSSPSAVPLASLGRRPDRIAAVQGLPPLLRSWLGLGAWVADHAVADPATDRLEVCVILDPSRIPPLRARALRAEPLA
jgi:hypothetical protein